MKDAFKRGIYGVLWCWPTLEILGWLEEKRLVMIYPLETAIILTCWMVVGWIVYDWLRKIGRAFRWPWR